MPHYHSKYIGPFSLLMCTNISGWSICEVLFDHANYLSLYKGVPGWMTHLLVDYLIIIETIPGPPYWQTKSQNKMPLDLMNFIMELEASTNIERVLYKNSIYNEL